MSDLAEAVALLRRGHELFAGPDAEVAGPVGGVGGRADQIAALSGRGGLPAAAAQRSAAIVPGLRQLGERDGELAAILAQARTNRQEAARATKLILDAALADSLPAADTPMGRREAMLRMIARLRAQHGHVVRSREQALVLAARLRRLLYAHASQDGAAVAAIPAGAGGRGAVLAAIRKALDIKGITDPVARARWERGMDLVAWRESRYDANALNDDDENFRKGTPSQGAWQFIAPTFAAYHEPGTSPNIRNLTSQACAFINYAQGHYGVAADGSNLADRIQQADPRRPPKGY